MGYRTIQKVRFNMRKYADVKRIYDKTQPIRGRSENQPNRPLGARRDVDTYHMKMRGDDVQFYLYRTPVVTYRPDGVIELFTDGWNSVSTRQFIEHVLNIRCYNKNSRMVVELGGTAQVTAQVMSNNRKDEVLLLKEVDGALVLLNPHDVMGYKINRAGANNVRARYKEFRNYLKGMLLLRAEPNTGKVNFEIAEFIEVLGTKTHAVSGQQYIDMHEMGYLCHKSINRYMPTKGKREGRNKFLQWIASEQGEDKLSNFYRAALILVANIKQLGSIANILDGIWGRTTTIEMYPTLVYLDELLMQLHAPEVLESVKLKSGTVPNTKYANWMHVHSELSSASGE